MAAVSRRAFLGATAVVPVAAAVSLPTSAATRRWIEGGLPASFPTQDPEVAQQVVGKSHVDIDAVRELVTARPELAKAAWDWGFGDWETALGAASHVGRPDIAKVLIAHGARPDMFTFAMLGQVDVIRALCVANPGIQKIHGPHGITLMQHAINAGEAGNDVVSYLRELGDADIAPPNTPLDAAAAAPYMGDYIPGAGVAPEMVLHIQHHERRQCLTFTRDDRSMRFLLNTGKDTFAPSGSPSVVITFAMDEGTAQSMTIRDGAMVVEAARAQ